MAFRSVSTLLLSSNIHSYRSFLNPADMSSTKSQDKPNLPLEFGKFPPHETGRIKVGGTFKLHFILPQSIVGTNLFVQELSQIKAQYSILQDELQWVTSFK